MAAGSKSGQPPRRKSLTERMDFAHGVFADAVDAEDMEMQIAVIPYLTEMQKAETLLYQHQLQPVDEALTEQIASAHRRFEVHVHAGNVKRTMQLTILLYLTEMLKEEYFLLQQQAQTEGCEVFL